jgi:hypothetical protein
VTARDRVTTRRAKAPAPKPRSGPASLSGPPAAATWRDGVHLTATPIWCDARRRVDVGFISAADQVARAGHGQLIATAATLALLGAGPGHLAVPLRRPFTLGTLRLELIPTGHGLGSAALHVDLGGRAILFAGVVCPRGVGLGEAAEVRAVEAVVVAAPHADATPGPSAAAAASAMVGWARAELAAGRRPALVVNSTLRGLDVATRLAADGVAVSATRAIRDAARAVAGLPGLHPPSSLSSPASLGDLATLASLALPGKAPSAVVALLADLPALRRAAPYRAALVSGAARGGHTLDAGFAWSGAADRPSLLGWLETTGARQIYLTGAGAEALAAHLGPRARVLGPPRQMTLF